MAVRLLSYISLLFEEIIRSEKLKPGDRLPAVLPLVLYNGRRPWRAPRDLQDLFVPLPEELRHRLPRLVYDVLDQGRLDLDGPTLARNRVAAAFRIETCPNSADIPSLIGRLARLLPRGKDPELRQTFSVWLLALLHRTLPGVRIPETVDLEEVPMLEETARIWARELRVQGMQRMLLRQMGLRFGRLPRDVRRQVEQITSVKKLDELSLKVLGAKSLREMGLG